MLEESPETLSNLLDQARFDLSKGITPFYCEHSQIPKYISGWLECRSSDLQPTWNNLIAILKKLTPTCADEIEKYLLSFKETDTGNQNFYNYCKLITHCI